MSITADLIRGHTDGIILAKLMEKDSYGYEINKSICKSTNQMYELKEATLYTAFKRLEDAGCISSYWGDETTGARRKYYTITNVGKSALKHKVEEWQEAKAVIDTLLDTEVNNGTET